MAKAQSVIDVMLGEGGGKTASERYADYLAIASVIANRATQLGVTPEQVVQRASEFNAYNKALPGGVDKYRGLAQKALAEVARNGPVHNATFYATPKAVGNLPRGLMEEVRTNSHIYKSDPQNRAIFTSVGLKSPDTTARYQPTVSAGSTLIGPVTNNNGDTLIGPVPGSKQSYRDPYVSAPNYKGNAPTVQITNNQNQRMYSPAGHIGVGQGGRASGAAMFAGGITSPAPGFEPAPSFTNSRVYSAPLNAPGVPYSPGSTLIGPVGPHSLGGGLVGPVQAVTPVQATPTPGDTLIGPVANKANDYATAQKAAQRTAAMPAMVSKIGGSLLGGALMGPVGSILGGLIGGYAAKNGLFRDAPMSINNIGAGANNVYGVYSGAARGTQATANNGGLVTSLGNGDTAYTNPQGISSVVDRYGNNMADWSGRSYSKK